MLHANNQQRIRAFVLLLRPRLLRNRLSDIVMLLTMQWIRAFVFLLRPRLRQNQLSDIVMLLTMQRIRAFVLLLRPRLLRNRLSDIVMLLTVQRIRAFVLLLRPRLLRNRLSDIVSRGQTAYFSFDMGAPYQKKISGLATRDYVRYCDVANNAADQSIRFTTPPETPTELIVNVPHPFEHIDSRGA